MTPFWRWDDAQKRPTPGSIQPGDIIAVARSVAVRAIQWALASSKPRWAKAVSHVGIACDNGTVIHTIPRKGSVGGGVAQIGLLPDMVEFGTRFVVLRWANGSSGAAVVSAARGLVGKPYSISQTVLDYLQSGPQTQIYRALQSDRNAAKALPEAFLCSTLVQESFALALSIHTPFALVRPVMLIPLPVEIVMCPGFDLILPNWSSEPV